MRNIDDFLDKKDIKFSDVLEMYSMLKGTAEEDDELLNRIILDVTQKEFEKCWAAYRIYTNRPYMLKRPLVNLNTFIKMLKAILLPELWARIIHRNRSTLVGLAIHWPIPIAKDIYEDICIATLETSARRDAYEEKSDLSRIQWSIHNGQWHSDMADYCLDQIIIDSYGIDRLAQVCDRRLLPFFEGLIHLYFKQQEYLADPNSTVLDETLKNTIGLEYNTTTSCIAALGTIGSVDAIDTLLTILHFPETESYKKIAAARYFPMEDMRVNVAYALARIHSERSVDGLIYIADSHSGYSQSNAMYGLGALASKRALPLLERIANERDDGSGFSYHAATARTAIERIKDIHKIKD